MSVASPPVSVEKFRNRIDASSSATEFEVVQGNDKQPDTLRLPDTDDMRSSRNRKFAFPATTAAASGQTRKDSKAESDRDIPSSALGCPPGSLVSCFEFIDPAQTPPSFGNTGHPLWTRKCTHHRAPSSERQSCGSRGNFHRSPQARSHYLISGRPVQTAVRSLLLVNSISSPGSSRQCSTSPM
jgi:hypothetical protein